MTRDEADKLACIAATADGGCPVCAARLCDELNAAFPAFAWLFEEVGDARRDDGWDDGFIIYVGERAGGTLCNVAAPRRPKVMFGYAELDEL